MCCKQRLHSLAKEFMGKEMQTGRPKPALPSATACWHYQVLPQRFSPNGFNQQAARRTASGGSFLPDPSKRSNWRFEGWRVRKVYFCTPEVSVPMDRWTV
jgi:hypothetical protein